MASRSLSQTLYCKAIVPRERRSTSTTTTTMTMKKKKKKKNRWTRTDGDGRYLPVSGNSECTLEVAPLRWDLNRGDSVSQSPRGAASMVANPNDWRYKPVHVPRCEKGRTRRGNGGQGVRAGRKYDLPRFQVALLSLIT